MERIGRIAKLKHGAQLFRPAGLTPCFSLVIRPIRVISVPLNP